MPQVIDDSFMVCTDCIMAIANDDYTGLDYYYQEPEATERMEAIQRGMANAPGSICVGDSEQDEEFSRSPCDCCGSDLHGARHHCVILD